MKTLADYPDLCAQLHPDDVSGIQPAAISYGSNQKLLWKCPVADDHVWKTSVKERAANGRGCPFCSGRRVSKSNSLESLHPELASMWHSTKNNGITPADVTAGSGKRFWWKCPLGDDHEFQARVVELKEGKTSCPYCNGSKVGSDNNLLHHSPKIAEEWHPTKNGQLQPENVYFKSTKKVWWQCPAHESHEWQMTINNRTMNGQKCPYCGNKRVCETNSLASLFPDISREWHPTKNGQLEPTQITAGSNRKVWWQCSLAKDHVWKTGPNSRTGRGDGCPFCSRIPKQASSTNNLALDQPEIAKQWHPTKNAELTPEMVLSNTTRKVWWLCDNGHEYQHSVNARVSTTRLCPYCSGYRIGQGNSFQDKYPLAAKEWDYEKNGDKTPEKLAPTSQKKFWFRCKKNHSYKTSLASRSGGSGCPKCTSQSSQPEIRIYTELKHLFPDTLHKHVLKKHELDVYIPSLKLAIEFDGSYWHRNSDAKDRRKNDFCRREEIKLVRVRQEPLKKIAETDLIVPKTNLTKTELDNVIKRIFFDLFHIEFMDNRIQKYLGSKTFLNDDLFEEYRTYFPMPHPSKSLATLRPELDEFWDYSKNYPLTPEYFTAGSNRRVYWICRKGHSYQKTIVDRVKAIGCPVCYKTRGRGRNTHPTIRDKRQLNML